MPPGSRLRVTLPARDGTPSSRDAEHLRIRSASEVDLNLGHRRIAGVPRGRAARRDTGLSR